MIVKQARQSRVLRPGFTLLEVLVVVAILVILASVAGIAVFSFLDDAKVNKAKLDMTALEKTYKAMAIQFPDEVNPNTFNVGMLASKMEQGQNALLDPWGRQYQHRFVQSSDTGEMRIQFFTINDKTGEEIFWPRY